jgi:hypothetical protein
MYYKIKRSSIVTIISDFLPSRIGNCWIIFIDLQLYNNSKLANVIERPVFNVNKDTNLRYRVKWTV